MNNNTDNIYKLIKLCKINNNNKTYIYDTKKTKNFIYYLIILK